MMAQAVGVTQFVEAGGLAAVHPAESGVLPGNFATAFGSAAKQADQASDQARLVPGTLSNTLPRALADTLPGTLRGTVSVQPASVVALPTAESPSTQKLSLDAALPGTDAPESDSAPVHPVPPKSADEKLVAVPHRTLSAPVAPAKTVSMAALPSLQPSLPPGKEAVALPKKTASVVTPVTASKAEVEVAAPMRTAPTIETQTSPASPVVLTGTIPPDAAGAPGEALQGAVLEGNGSVLEVSGAVLGGAAAVAVPDSFATPDAKASQVQKTGKRGVAESTKQTATSKVSTAKSDLPQIAPSSPPAALPLTPHSASAPSPVLAAQADQAGQAGLPTQADLTTAAVNRPAAALPQVAGVSRLMTAPASLGSVVRAPASPLLSGAALGDAVGAKTAGTTIDDKVVASVSSGKTDAAAVGTLKPAASAASSEPYLTIVNTTVAAAPALTSSVQATTAVPAPVPLMPVASGHASPAADLPLSINIAEHAAGVGLLAPTSTGLTHTTISATPTTLEVGVASGTHGWLKIRAELSSAGEVNASLTGGTPSEASKLRGELPALSSYLQAEQVQVSGLSVHAALHAAVVPTDAAALPGSESSGTGSTNTFSASTNAGSTSGQAQHQADPGGESVVVPGGVEDSLEGVSQQSSMLAAYGSRTGLGNGSRPLPVEYGSGGGWLNVRV